MKEHLLYIQFKKDIAVSRAKKQFEYYTISLIERLFER